MLYILQIESVKVDYITYIIIQAESYINILRLLNHRERKKENDCVLHPSDVSGQINDRCR